MGQYQKDFDKLIEELPPIRLLSAPELKRNSYLITILGFEPRCFAVAQSFSNSGLIFDKSFCIKYTQTEMRDFNFKYEKKLVALLESITQKDQVHYIEHEDRDFNTDFGEKLIKELSVKGIDVTLNDTNIYFDITVGSSRLLLEGLHALFLSKISLTLLYSESTVYRPFFCEYRSFLEESKYKEVPAPEFLTYGVENVEIVKRMSGRNADSLPTYLALFPSFTPIRLGAVLEEVSPSRVYWLFGVPHLVKNRWRIDAQSDYHKKWIENSHRHCFVSTFYYTEALQALEGIYQKIKGNYGMMVCSLGSKLQKIGQVLFHILRPEVGAIVSVPKTWDTENYSDDEPRAIYSIQFENCELLKKELWLTRKLKY